VGSPFKPMTLPNGAIRPSDFRCHTFVDAGGERFLSDVQEFEAIDWNLRMAV